MNSTAPGTAYPFPFSSAFATILITGIIAGLLDGLAAIAIYLQAGGDDPLRIFIYIASGAFGDSAFPGSTEMIISGLIFHFLIAIIFSALYFIIYPLIGLKNANWILSGLIYGILVWCIMNLIVLPLSHVPHPIIYKPLPVVKGIIVLMVMIGLPISYMLHRYYSYRRSQAR